MEGHSKNCIYNDNDAMLYIILVMGEHRLLLSAREYQVFEQYLDFSYKNDEGVIIDMESADKEPFCIVYGGVMFGDHEYKDIEILIDSLKGFALLDLDRDVGELAASAYEDIVLYPELAKMENFVPFAALMQTTHPFDNPDISVTMFPLMGDHCIWEHMANKPFLLACRRKIDLDSNVTVNNWKDYIDIDQLEETYRVADLYTGPLDEEERRNINVN